MKPISSLIIAIALVAACTDAADAPKRRNNDSSSSNISAAATTDKSTVDTSVSTSVGTSNLNDIVSPDEIAKRMETVSKAEPGVASPSTPDFDQQVQNLIFKAFLDQQAQAPTSMTKAEAAALATKFIDVLKIAKGNNPALTSKAVNDLFRTVSAYRSQKTKGLELYDNSTIIGRGFNAANGVIDLIVELYAAVLNLDLAAVGRVGSSAARLLTQLIATN